MNPKNLLLNAAILSMSSLVMAQTALTTSGNINYVSDYKFRGISQTSGNMAVQGGFDVTYGGFYIGTWSSNVEMSDANIESDVYGGYTGKLTKALTFDVGLITYQYPGNQSSYDFNEIYGSLSMPVYGVTSTLGVNYSDDFFAASGNATYYSLNLSLPTKMKNLTANTAIGRQVIDNSVAYGTDDYTDFTFSLGYLYRNMTVGLTYNVTDECTSTGTDQNVVVSLSSSM
jgi:uncharacterized protein (TIGR02001 family)